MRVTGIIAEYNPIHSGHISQLRRIKNEYGADYIVVAMSGDFVQRGEPAVFDKALRARAALLAGADLVLELPVFFSTAPAPDFAAAGVALMDKLGIVTDLCFGSECGDISLLSAAADVLCDEPDIFKDTLRESQKSGDTYARAQARAFQAALKADMRFGEASDADELFSSPNNILGIEYIKSLKLRHSTIRPVTYKREGQSYHDTSPEFLSSDGTPSASAIREALKEGSFDYFDHINGIIPSDEPIGPATPVFADDLSELLNEKLLEVTCGHSEREISDILGGYYGFTPELAFRLTHQIPELDTFTGRAAHLKSRSCTYARVSRALLHLILGITNEEVDTARKNDYISYIRVLGFRKSSESLLNAIHKNSSLPLITKTAGADKYPGADGCCINLSRDLFASHLYRTLVFESSGTILPNEYSRPLLIV